MISSIDFRYHNQRTFFLNTTFRRLNKILVHYIILIKKHDYHINLSLF